MEFKNFMQHYNAIIDPAKEQIDEITSIVQQNEAEIADLERKLSKKTGLPAEEYRQAQKRLDDLNTDNQFYSERLNELMEKSPTTREEFEALRADIMKELRATQVAADQAIFEKMQSVIEAAEFYTTELNILKSLYFNSGRCLGRGFNIYDLAWPNSYLTKLISGVNKFVLSDVNTYAKEHGEAASACIDAARLNEAEREIVEASSKLNCNYLPETAVYITRN